jgi:spore maturation protein CgeB
VRWIGHVATHQHNAVNSSAKILLNINRESMAHVGFSPPTRVFEAAGAARCVITDRWPGIEQFFAPGREILIASSAEEIAEQLRFLDADQCDAIGGAMKDRALREHTYELRVKTVDSILKVSPHGAAVHAKQAVPA